MNKKEEIDHHKKMIKEYQQDIKVLKEYILFHKKRIEVLKGK